MAVHLRVVGLGRETVCGGCLFSSGRSKWKYKFENASSLDLQSHKTVLKYVFHRFPFAKTLSMNIYFLTVKMGMIVTVAKFHVTLTYFVSASVQSVLHSVTHLTFTRTLPVY